MLFGFRSRFMSLISRDLWSLCEEYGKVVDVFIPNQKSKAGKRFAFVRFIKVDDMDQLIGNLCTLWLGRLHFQANAVRYERPPKSSPSVKLPSVKSYAPFTSSPSGSFADAVKDIKNFTPHSSPVSCSPALVLDDTCVNVLDVSGQVMGRTKDVNSISNLRTILTNEGFMDVKLSYLGGLWVMIELNSKETIMKLLQHTGVNSWFEELKPTSQEFVCNERIVWVDIEGIPLHLCPQAPRVNVHEVNEKEDPSLSHPPRFTPVTSHQDPIHSNSAHLEVNQDEPPITKGSSSKSYPKTSCFSQASHGNDSSADSSTHVSSRSTPKGGSILEVLDGMIKVGRSMGYDMEGCLKDIEQIISGLIGNSGGILCVWEETIFKKVDVSISDNFIALYGIWLPTNSKILIVVKMEGYSFTWSHSSASKMSKLDRFLVLEGIFLTFPTISVICLDRHLSDHTDSY
nr:hypothetical protein [Tanacetum cinerariifolium]